MNPARSPTEGVSGCDSTIARFDDSSSSCSEISSSPFSDNSLSGLDFVFISVASVPSNSVRAALLNLKCALALYGSISRTRSD